MFEPTPVNHDPAAERLAAFTPQAAKFDRDDLLFAAGKASARTSPIWPAMVGVLLLLQISTLILLPDSIGSSPTVVLSKLNRNDVEPRSPMPANEIDVALLKQIRSTRDLDAEYRPQPVDGFLRSEVLTAFSARNLD